MFTIIFVEFRKERNEKRSVNIFELSWFIDNVEGKNEEPESDKMKDTSFTETIYM